MSVFAIRVTFPSVSIAAKLPRKFEGREEYFFPSTTVVPPDVSAYNVVLSPPCRVIASFS